MDPMRALDMEVRSGISSSDIDDFASRMDLISEAMEQIKSGTFDPATCKIPGYKTLEQEETEQREKRKREDERRRREHERKCQREREERETWWMKAKLRFSTATDDDDTDTDTNNSDKAQVAANRALAAYTERDANDYSVWRKWEPRDPATLEETAERDAALELERNRAFEASNPEFCDQFRQDQAARQQSQRDKERIAEKCKQQGNVCYRRKQYDAAIAHYMQALDASPFHVAVLTNIAQCCLRLHRLDATVEFSTRALFIAPNHVKALSRRAAAWHQQRRFEDAAADVARAMALAPTNDDLVEQHSMIVGDLEDAVAQQQLAAALDATKVSTTIAADTSSADIHELRFVSELLKRMDERDDAPADTDTRLAERSAGDTVVWSSWIAYELLTPLLARSDRVRTLFRTSHELQKLCYRIVTALDNVTNDDIIVAAMVACATAALTDCARNQLVTYNHALFRKHMLAALVNAKISISISDTNRGNKTAQSSVLEFFDEAVALKSWKRLLLSSRDAVRALLRLLPTPAASCICLTLSSDAHGLAALVFEPVAAAQALAAALDTSTTSRTDLATVTNVLGVLTNVSTVESFRLVIGTDDARDDPAVQRLGAVLLQIAHDSVTAVGTTTLDVTAAERALAAVLNLSYYADAPLRRDLATCDAVRTLTAVLRTVTPATFELLALTLARAVGLFCRLHAVVSMTGVPATLVSSASSSNADDTMTVQQQLTHCELLDELYRICLLALSTAASSGVPTATWQLCAQIWCHVGWCVEAAAVRVYLCERRVVHAIFETLRHTNAQPSSYRSVPADSDDNDARARERLVGNAVKVLIALQRECEMAVKPTADAALMVQPANLAVLVDALQLLPDGLARKNVAILLARLCRTNTAVKDEVRKLRGIEMMLAVSQSLQQQQQASSINAGTTAHKRFAAPGAAF